MFQLIANSQKNNFKNKSSKEIIPDWHRNQRSRIENKYLPRTSEWKIAKETVLDSEEFFVYSPVIHNSKLFSYIQQRQLNPILEENFNKLAIQWQSETCGLSSITKKITNLNYLKIIAMGKAVVPLILQSLKRQPDHWFIALKALTDQDPTNPNHSFDQAVESWLNWGKNEGLID